MIQIPLPRATIRLVALAGALTAGLPAPAGAQGAAFQSPGMPRSSSSGQSLKFASEYNPAISFVLDAIADWVDHDDPAADDGADLSLRAAELGLHSWIDPSAWAYAAVVFDEEQVTLEEGAVVYNGLGGNSSLKAGRFFIDFGKQMQAHRHELSTIERPAALRTFLGEELHGDGVEYGNWFSVGEVTVVRYSFGVFRTLVREDLRYDAGGNGLNLTMPDRLGLDQLSYSGRITALTEVGDFSNLQLGLSARRVSEFGFEDPGAGLAVDGLSNTVYGADVTFGQTDETVTRGWSAGLELLVHDGDFGADPAGAEGGTIQAFGGRRTGHYVWADRQLGRYTSFGLQSSEVELLEPGDLALTEYDAYWTRYFSDYQRLRLGVTAVEDDLGGDSFRLAVQYTNVIGPHTHGLNW